MDNNSDDSDYSDAESSDYNEHGTFTSKSQIDQNSSSGLSSTKKYHKGTSYSKKSNSLNKKDHTVVSLKSIDNENDEEFGSCKTSQYSYCDYDSNEDTNQSEHSPDASFTDEKQVYNESRFGKRKHESFSTTDAEAESNKRAKTKETQNLAASQTYSIAAQRMMKNMGYQDGEGLGKFGQGRAEPVEASIQHGRRGIGHRPMTIENIGLEWDPSQEEKAQVKEDMSWLSNETGRLPELKDMKGWIVQGPRKKTIEDETTFCDPEVVANVVNAKNIFNNFDKVEMRRARTRSNPYETIRNAIFLNRAAVKMANIDRACNFMFTPETKKNELLYFADVCAGPGGFSEYILWRMKWRAKGFGFTLKNENDFKLDDFYAGPCETFHPFYGPKENGDVFDPANQNAFRDLIMQHTCGKGVHFMMSDGGFSVDGQENIQEILSKQLYLCQCLVALMIVREGGNFVTKLFDLFTLFSAGLVYLMYHCFDKICIFKPNTSRPANSERYLICKGKRRSTQSVVDYLCEVNRLLLEGDDDNDVMQLVPLNVLEKEGRLIEYLRESNNTLGRKQIMGLLKIAAFCKNPTLTEPNQADMRKRCLEYWNIPDNTRTIPRHVEPQEKLREILNGTSASFINSEAENLTLNTVPTVLSNPYDWYFVVCGAPRYADKKAMATLYMGMGRRKVYRLEGQNWVHLDDSIALELPPNTLVYAELVYEFSKNCCFKTQVLHIIDAYSLGGENVNEKPIDQRNEITKIFCEALCKPPPTQLIQVRAKGMHLVDDQIRQNLQMKLQLVKNKRDLTYEISLTHLDKEPRCFVPLNVIFLKSTTEQWHRHWSTSHSRFYMYNKLTKDSVFSSDKKEPHASFVNTYQTRVIWQWPSDNSVSDEEIFKHVESTQSNHRKYSSRR